VAILDGVAPSPVRRTSCRAEGVGEQGSSSHGSRAGAVCFGVRGAKEWNPRNSNSRN
jgi:hypothetical protein